MTATTGGKPERDSIHQPSHQPETERRREHTDLGGRYGAIGISAVAAALRYAGGGKNPAYAPVVHRTDRRFAEAAA